MKEGVDREVLEALSAQPVEVASTVPIGSISDIRGVLLDASESYIHTKVDLESLTGLRGVAALWIAVFHYALYSRFPIDLQGSSIMPLFFMLSGFCLTVVYGRRRLPLRGAPPAAVFVCRTHSEVSTRFDTGTHNNDDGTLTSDLDATDSNDDRFDRGKFLRNRFARVGPVYYMTMLFAIPSVAPCVCPRFVASLIVSIVPVNTWLSFVVGGSVDGPAWTIATLCAFYLYFHKWLATAQRMTDYELCLALVQCYNFQLLLVLVIYPGLVWILGFWPAFATATMNPLTRYPLFTMGIYAGVLVLRHNGIATMPWPRSRWCTLRSVDMVHRSVADWKQSTDRYSKYLLCLTLLTSFGDAMLRIFVDKHASIAGAIWLQALVPMWQLEVMVGLSRDCGISTAAWVLRTRVAQWFGQMSLALYLVHFPLIAYTCWLTYGYSKWRHEGMEIGARYTVIPVWTIPATLACAIVLAFVVNRFLEEPMRRRFRC